MQLFPTLNASIWLSNSVLASDSYKHHFLLTSWLNYWRRVERFWLLCYCLGTFKLIQINSAGHDINRSRAKAWEYWATFYRFCRRFSQLKDIHKTSNCIYKGKSFFDESQEFRSKHCLFSQGWQLKDRKKCYFIKTRNPFLDLKRVVFLREGNCAVMTRSENAFLFFFFFCAETLHRKRKSNNKLI